LRDAKAALDRIKDFVFNLKSAKLQPGSNPKLAAVIQKAREDFEAALDDDLNTSGALGALSVLIRQSNIALTSGQLQEDDRNQINAWLKVVDERLAIIPPMEQLVQGDEEIEALLARRSEAKRNRDFAMSDKIRQQLNDLGVVIEDT